MSYVLDGIKTAMMELETPLLRVDCPCGFSKVGTYDLEGKERWRAALRFHYTHCPQARLPAPGGDEGECG